MIKLYCYLCLSVLFNKLIKKTIILCGPTQFYPIVTNIKCCTSCQNYSDIGISRNWIYMIDIF